MSGHTPGPWRTTHTGFLGVGILPSTGEMRTEGGPIITCWSAGIGNSETEANARLIAEAPTLLHEAAFLLDRIAELDWCDFDRFARDWGGHVDPPLERLRAAIRRATNTNEG